MQTLKFFVKEQIIYMECMDRIVIEGSRSFVNSFFALDEEWAALTVYVLFENDALNGPPIKVLLTSDTIDVPPEVLVTGLLRVGLVGLGDDGTVRLTTKRMSGAIPVYRCGGTDGEDAEELTPELWEQAIAAIGPLGALETEDKSNLVAAINEARLTGGGGSGGGGYRIGSGLKLDAKTNTLSVDTADAVEGGNTKPITSAAVYTEVGNINALLATI